MVNIARGAILTNFLALEKGQCNSKVREQILPYLEETSVIDPPLKDATHLCQCWKFC